MRAQPGEGGRHGTHYWYVRARCRCADCREANRLYQMVGDIDRARRLRQNPSLATHGTVSTYKNWGCRCEPCKAAQAVANRRGRERRAKASIPRSEETP